MANDRIIFLNGSGGVGVLLVTPEKLLLLLDELPELDTIDKKLQHVANKDLPTGTKYELIDSTVDLSDRTFRDAWEYTADASVEAESADLTAAELTLYNMSENR